MTKKNKRLYRVLAVKTKASQEEILKAFRRLSMTYHPDRNPGDEKAAEKFRDVQHAYDVLGHPARREVYDETGEEIGSVADETWSKHMPMILTVFDMIMEDMVEKKIDPKLFDVLKLFDNKCAELIENGKKMVKDFQTKADFYGLIAGRVKIDAEDNILSGAMKEKQTTYQLHVEGAKKELSILIRSRELVKDYKYDFVKQISSPLGYEGRVIHFNLPSGFFGNR